MLTSHFKETKQPHKKFKVDWFWGYISRYTPRRYGPAVRPPACLSYSCTLLKRLDAMTRRCVGTLRNNMYWMVLIVPTFDVLTATVCIIFMSPVVNRCYQILTGHQIVGHRLAGTVGVTTAYSWTDSGVGGFKCQWRRLSSALLWHFVILMPSANVPITCT